MNKLESLQLLRAIAAIWVMITHVFQRLNIRPFGYLLSGQYGVDVFFILSGFIIYVTTKESDTWKKFAIKRIFRIFPLYLLCFVCYAFFFVTEHAMVLSPVKWIENVLMIPFSDAIGFKSLIVVQAWSTCYEMYFYFLMTFLLFLGVGKHNILWVLGLLFVIGLPLNYFLHTPLSNCGFGRYVFSLIGAIHIPKFMVGIGLAMMYYKNTPSSFCVKCRRAMTSNWALVMIPILYLFVLMSCYNHLFAFVVSSIFFYFTLYVSPRFDRLPNTWVKRFAVFLGDISFSVYLVHMLIILIFIEIFHVQSLWILLMLTMVTVLCVSAITYKYVEQPFIRVGRKIVSKW